MKILRFIDRFLSGFLLVLFFLPIIVLTIVSRFFNFLDYLIEGKLSESILSILALPFTILATLLLAITYSFANGWQLGFVDLFASMPQRIIHFFTKELFFGSGEEEFIANFFRAPILPSGLDFIVSPGFFGKLTLKLLSLCVAMEFFLAFDAKTVSAHNDVSIYFTEKNLAILKKNYEDQVKDQEKELQTEISDYLTAKLITAQDDLKIIEKLPATNDSKSGKLQSKKDEIFTIKTAQNAIRSFAKTNIGAVDLSIKSSSMQVLNYVWLAIKTETKDSIQAEILRTKLVWTLFLIQRGFNIVNNDNGADMPECPTGAIGLMVRVLCNEKDKMPSSEYSAEDPTPANLSEALKSTMDRPFKSSTGYVLSNLMNNYTKDPIKYKNEHKENLTKLWSHSYSPLLKTGLMKENALKDLIDAGVEAWEPPFLDLATFN